MIRDAALAPATLDVLRRSFRAARHPHVLVPSLIGDAAAAALRARVEEAGLDPYYEPDRGRYHANDALDDPELFAALRGVAERVVERRVAMARARWLRLRHGDYLLMRGDAGERLAAPHLELTLDFSATTTGQAEIGYTDGADGFVVPQMPASLAVVARGPALCRFERYLNVQIGDATVYRLRLALVDG